MTWRNTLPKEVGKRLVGGTDVFFNTPCFHIRPEQNITTVVVRSVGLKVQVHVPRDESKIQFDTKSLLGR